MRPGPLDAEDAPPARPVRMANHTRCLPPTSSFDAPSVFRLYAVAAYFVTLVTHERAELFGRVIDGVMHVSAIGEVVQEEWLKSSAIRPELELDEFVVMPNHLHGIVIVARDLVAHAEPSPPTRAHSRAPLQRAPRSLGSFVSGFKATTTRRGRRRRLADDKPLFQRNYFERVIRNWQELDRIRTYIADNPRRWLEDPENPR